MKKLISMLLAVSMSLSVICSSFTVAAVDENDTEIAQTENAAQNSSTGFEGLFANEINEKFAERSNDCGISSVEVSGNTATVSYWSSKDCTVIVGIYEDNGTNGTHMLTFGTASIKASETTAAVTIDNLPQYFYLKAYLVDSESYRPLTVEYTNSYYTKSKQDFFDLTISDFIEDGYDEDRIINLDGSDSNNFIVYDKKVKIINDDLEIGVDDLTFTEKSITVNNNADTDENIYKLKNGDVFLFFTENGILAGIASGIRYDGSTVAIDFTEATTADVFDHVRIDTSDITPRYSADSYSTFGMRSSDEVNAIYPFSGLDISISRTMEPIAGDASVSAIFSITGSIEGNLTVNYSIADVEAIIELSVTPKFKIGATGIGKLSQEVTLIDKSLPIVIIGGIPAVSLNLNLTSKPDVKFEVSGTFEVSATFTATANINESNLNDMLKFNQSSQKLNDPKIEIGGKVTADLPVSLTFGVDVLRVKFGSDKNPIIDTSLISVNLEDALWALVSIGASTGNLVDGVKHNCEPLKCFNGTRSITNKVNLNVKSPVLKLLSDGNKVTALDGKIIWSEDKITFNIAKTEFIPEAEQKFNIKLDPFSLSWGECDNFSYRTYIHVVAEDDNTASNGIKDAYVINKTEIYDDGNILVDHEDRTNRGGVATIYINPRKNTNIIISVSDLPNTDNINENNYVRGIFDDTDHVIRITNPDTFEADQNITIPVKLTGKPTEIVPYPVENDAVPKYKVGEDLRYSGLTVTYGTGNGARTFKVDLTDDMIKNFDSTVVGKQTLVLEFNGFSCTQEIEIIEDKREVESISINTMPDKTEYQIGESLDITGLTIDIKYSDNTTDEAVRVTSDMVSGFDSSTKGEKTITVTYTDTHGNTAETTFTVNVVNEERTVESIRINTLPDKTEYAVGEALDISGLTIDVNFADGTSATNVAVTSSMVSGFDSSTAGTKTLTVTYTDKYENEATATFTVTVADEDSITKIEIFQLFTPNKYCELSGTLNLENVLIKAYHSDESFDLIQVTEDMISGFDSSSLGTFPVTVTYGDCHTSYEVEVLENSFKLYKIDFNLIGYVSSISWVNGFAADYIDNPYGDYNELEHAINVYTYFANGISYYQSFDEGDIDEEHNITIHVPSGGTIKITGDFDRTAVGIHEIKATYYLENGERDYSVPETSAWFSIIGGGLNSENCYETAFEGDIRYPYVGTIATNGNCGYYYVGDKINFDDLYLGFDEYKYRSGSGWWWVNSTGLEWDGNQHILTDPKHRVTKANYLGGFDASNPTKYIGYSGSHYAYFEIDGWIGKYTYEVKAYEPSDTIEASYNDISNYNDNTNYDTNNYIFPIEYPYELEMPIDTKIQLEESAVVETAEVDETPTFGNDSSVVFGFGRAGRKTAQYANLHNNDIYNYYVVRNAAANLLDKDNLLFVGQGSSDSMGGLSFEYETTTGEDGTIILRPMSDDPTTPDTPNQPTTPDNGGSSSNTNPSTVIPVGGTKTETMTVKVENKVTGKTSKAIAQKTDSSVTVKLGTENNGYYANVYTTDDEYIYSVLIENGRAKFNVPDDVKIKIVIDSISYGEDVSSAAGAAADGEPVNIPYPVIVVLIAAFGVYIKVGKKYFGQKKQR